MKIGELGFVSLHLNWLLRDIIEIFGKSILQNSIEVYGREATGYEIQFKLSLTGMIFELRLDGKYFLISAILLNCKTLERIYLLKREGLEVGFKETIDRMKVLLLDKLDSISIEVQQR